MASTVHDDTQAMAEINVTPLVDVLLVLLIIFMIAMPMMTQRIPLTLPQPTPPPPERVEPLRLRVESGDLFRLDGRPMSRPQLQLAFEEASARDAGITIALSVDRDAEYQSVVDALALAERSGIDQFGLSPE
ncbi:MAG TPA: biopolymer transporter ExbD [Arenimonas sp.]|nr:biopolymer transporter ExbD [Arenimonas sp.]